MKGLKLSDIIKFKNNKTLLQKILNKYIISKQEKLDIIESLENVASNVTLITFYYDDVEYTAEKGMTWYDFCNSKYNVDGWSTDLDMTPGSTITTYEEDWGFGGAYHVLSYKEYGQVSPTEIILENYRYSYYGDGWGVGNGGAPE